MASITRRELLRTAAMSAAGAAIGWRSLEALAQPPGERPEQAPTVKVLNPRDRVPVSFIIDDSQSIDVPQVTHAGLSQPLTEVAGALDLAGGTFHRHADGVSVCFDLRQGTTVLAV